MNTKSIKTWDEFVAAVEDLYAQRDAHTKKAMASVSELLYRGQPDSRLNLDTTLDRIASHPIKLRQYYHFVSVIKAKIESVIGRTWAIPSPSEFDHWIEKQYPPFPDLPGYAFLAYLRHHGLPSPLLDWTKSPYVAAHFAMAQPPREGASDVAIYAYLESPEGIKTGDVDAPAIQSLGPYIATHRRHYLQQSVYTICTSGMGDSIQFFSHEDVVARDEKGQDLLWKLVIPISERRCFIERLQRMNINPFSLFETEDKLMEDIYLSEMFLMERL